MGIIKKLDSIIIDRIAAGEVIERPSSVVKELIENSLDAKAKKIHISTYEGGIQKIIVRDDGEGILTEDLPIAIEKHTTSKVSTIEDIQTIQSFGFRGEALSSIASVSYLEIQTKHKHETIGNQLISRGGKILSLKPYPIHNGTKVIVEDLFFSTPARKKFLKSNSIEDRYILRNIIKLSLSNYDVEFLYTRDDKEILQLLPVEFYNLTERFNAIFEDSFSELLLPVYFQENQITIKGWIGKPRLERKITDRQFLYFNKRPVEIRNFSYIIKSAYGDLLPENVSPIYILFFEIPPQNIDVNVHPAKKEIRIFQEKEIYDYTIQAIKKTLLPKVPISIAENELKTEPDITLKKKPSSILFPIETLYANQTIFYLQETSDPYTIYDHEEKQLKKSFLPLQFIGIIFGTYIIASSEDQLYLIDQHTAHERINYEKFKKSIEKNGISSQHLLSPMIIDFSLEEVEEINQYKHIIEKYGFCFHFVSKTSIVLTEIPTFLEIGEEREIFLKLIYKIIKGIEPLPLYEEYIAMKACKASFRKNDYLTEKTIQQLLIELSKCEEPSRCPHGRPTMLTISKDRLDYLFYRTGFKKKS